MSVLADLQHVSRSYGTHQALRDVSLHIESGMIGLVGNNGAGKSTLLKILLGLLKPDSGSGTILDSPLGRGGTRLRRRIGYMAENEATVPILSGFELVMFSGDLYGMSHREAKRRAHEVLYYVGLGELRYRRLTEYSTGNLQRLKLAAALVHDPELLLLDEPTSGLDPQGRESFLQLLEDLIAETGKSLILSTHLLGDIERLCQQVVVLDRGQVHFCGPKENLISPQESHYHLAWQGEEAEFLSLLTAAGVAVEHDARRGEVLARVPESWHTREFFDIAQQARVTLTKLAPVERTFEEIFFQLTQGEPHHGD